MIILIGLPRKMFGRALTKQATGDNTTHTVHQYGRAIAPIRMPMSDKLSNVRRMPYTHERMTI